ncbi:MAG: ferritin [Xenococcus sp. (in: cyanobacteria)]
MSNEGYHEPIHELTGTTREMHRAITSLMEELEAIDWYNQRVNASADQELQRIPTTMICDRLDKRDRTQTKQELIR